MTTLNDTTFNQISTIDVTPPLSVDNYDVGNSDIVRQYTDTTIDAIQRFYCSFSIIALSFKQKMHLPETPGIMKLMVEEQLLAPLSAVYPEFQDFQFEITNSGSIIGKNDVANNILNFICRAAKTPVLDSVVDGVDENKLVHSYTDDIYEDDEDYDDDLEEEDDDDFDLIDEDLQD